MYVSLVSVSSFSPMQISHSLPTPLTYPSLSSDVQLLLSNAMICMEPSAIWAQITQCPQAQV